MGNKYANPPLVEAVCEFRLSEDSPWDLTLPGLFYEKVKDIFPEKRQVRVQEILVSQTPQGIGQKVQASDRIQFFSPDQKKLVQIGPRLLSIHCLKPYPSWNEYKPLIEKAYRALRNVADLKGFKRIGLRYVNLINIPGAQIKLEEFFEFRPHLGPRLPPGMDDLFLGCILSLDEGRDCCKVELKNIIPDQPGGKENSSFVLDLDYYPARPETFGPDQAMEWVEKAHHHIEDVFEGCASEKLKKIWE